MHITYYTIKMLYMHKRIHFVYFSIWYSVHLLLDQKHNELIQHAEVQSPTSSRLCLLAISIGTTMRESFDYRRWETCACCCFFIVSVHTSLVHLGGNGMRFDVRPKVVQLCSARHCIMMVHRLRRAMLSCG